MLTETDVTELIFERKRESGMSWAEISGTIGLSEVFTTSACLGINSLPEDKVESLVAALNLPEQAGVVLTECPNKVFSQSIPTDPCIYRLYEIVGVYGETLKELIQEKGGDGTMSAIDFETSLEKVPNEKGDRIEIKMSGKFLPYYRW